MVTLLHQESKSWEGECDWLILGYMHTPLAKGELYTLLDTKITYGGGRLVSQRKSCASYQKKGEWMLGRQNQQLSSVIAMPDLRFGDFHNIHIALFLAEL